MKFALCSVQYVRCSMKFAVYSVNCEAICNAQCQGRSVSPGLYVFPARSGADRRNHRDGIIMEDTVQCVVCSVQCLVFSLQCAVFSV